MPSSGAHDHAETGCHACHEMERIVIHMDLISWGFVVLALAGVGFITLAIVKDWS